MDQFPMKLTRWNVSQSAFPRNEKVFDSVIKLLIENGILIRNKVENKGKDKSLVDKITTSLEDIFHSYKFMELERKQHHWYFESHKISLLGFLFFPKFFSPILVPKYLSLWVKTEKSFNFVACHLKLYFEAGEMTQLLIR